MQGSGWYTIGVGFASNFKYVLKAIYNVVLKAQTLLLS